MASGLGGLVQLTGPALPWLACVSAIAIVWTFVRSRSHAADSIVTLALAAAAALPLVRVLKGHPLRIRYDVPLVAAAAALTGVGSRPAAASRARRRRHRRRRARRLAGAAVRRRSRAS